MKYPVANIGLTISELPGETAVYIEFSGCTQRCQGCHSPELHEVQEQDLLTLEEIILNVAVLVEKYNPDITAVLLMGGTANEGMTEEDLEKLVGELAATTKLQVGLYSGVNEYPDKYLYWSDLMWLKTGAYKEALGGLEESTTNQRFYKKEKRYTFDRYGCYVSGKPYWEDHTYKFQSKETTINATQPTKS